MIIKREHLEIILSIALTAGIFYLGVTAGQYENCMNSGLNMTCEMPWWMWGLP